MTRDELKSVMQMVETAYGTHRFAISQSLFNLWYRIIGEQDYADTVEAARRYIRENEYAPSIAGMVKAYRDVQGEKNEIMSRLKSNYDNITSLYPGGGDAESWKMYLHMLDGIEKDRQISASEWLIRKVGNDVDKGGNMPKLVDYLRGLCGEQTS